MKLSLKRTCVIFFIFLAIFDPPIFSFNIIFILLPVSLIYVFIHTSGKLKICGQITLGGAIILGYILVIVGLGMLFGEDSLLKNRIAVLYQLFFLMPAQCICAYAVCIYAKTNKLSRIDIYEMCIRAGVIEGILVIISFFVPNVRAFFLSIMINKAGKGVYTAIMNNDSAYRAYGFADSLLDTFGYGIGLLAGFCLLKEKKEIKTYVIMGVLLFSTAVNSRTGLAVFMLALVIQYLSGFNERKHKLKKYKEGIIITLIIITAILVVTKTSLKESSTISWITAGFESVYSIIFHKEMSYRLGSMQGSLLTERFWVLPDGFISIFLGRGHSIYDTRSILGINSDVGYINYIWICGILGETVLLLFISLIFRKIYRKAITKYEKKIVIFISLAFFLVFIKGNILTHTAGTFITVLCIASFLGELCDMEFADKYSHLLRS